MVRIMNDHTPRVTKNTLSQCKWDAVLGTIFRVFLWIPFKVS